MNFFLTAALSACIIIPAIIGLARFGKINKAYYPFIYCVWTGTINETLSIIIVSQHYSNSINGNIYLLLESFLLAWQFKRWNLFGSRNTWFIITLCSLLIVWCIENFIISEITLFNSYFRIFYCSLITFMSISVINRLIVTERKRLIKNPTFILCATFVMYYTLNVLSEIFWVYGNTQNKNFRLSIYDISVVTNFITIILYSLAILWMPIKQRFTLPSL